MINPDKYAVGGDQYLQTESFTRHQVSIQTGDCIYLTTDGFADQFGGPNGKKIMTRQFKDLLLSVHELNMWEQKQQLKQFFEHWKGDREQVDDVLVIGCKC